MIYALGIDKDPGFVHFLKESLQQLTQVQPINIKHVIQNGSWQLVLPDDGNSFIQVDGSKIDLDPKGGYYCRIYDLSSKKKSQSDRALWLNFITGIYAWLENIDGIVVNRPDASVDNFAKPLHEYHLAMYGLSVPESTTSCSREKLINFCKEGPTIGKSVSGVRANSQIVMPSDLKSYQPSWGPAHLQRFIKGHDIRVHVVGNDVHAEMIISTSEDYRSPYAKNLFCPYKLPESLASNLIKATAAFGLAFAGWDLKIDSDGVYWCLEANSLPGYFGYDRRCEGAITRSLLNILHGV